MSVAMPAYDGFRPIAATNSSWEVMTMSASKRIPPLPLPLLVIGVAAIAAAIGYMVGATLEHGRSELWVWSADQSIVNKALDEYGQGKISRADLLKAYQPMVVYLPDKTCVGMRRRNVSLGGEDTMCFDKAGERLLFYYNTGP